MVVIEVIDFLIFVILSIVLVVIIVVEKCPDIPAAELDRDLIVGVLALMAISVSPTLLPDRLDFVSGKAAPNYGGCRSFGSAVSHTDPGWSEEENLKR